MLADRHNEEAANSNDLAPAPSDATGAVTEPAAKHPGRKKKDPPVFVAPIAEGQVVHLPLAAVHLDDPTFMFRANLRVGDLANSIKVRGQQIPIIVRPHPSADGYQIISGFRRATAIKELGWDVIAAIVRELDDEAAFSASVLENTARKTYSDIDRAHVFKAHKDRGFGSDGIGQMMGLSLRQVNNLLGLLELPKTVQDALSDPDKAFKATHALFLKKMKKKYPKLDYGKWIRVTNDENLSVAQLTRRINEAYRDKDGPLILGVLNQKTSDVEKGTIHFKPMKVEVGELTEEEKTSLKAELTAIIERLR